MRISDIALGVFLAAAFATGAGAQSPKGPPPGGRPDFMAKLADDLGIVGERRARYDAAAKETAEKMRDLHQKKVSGAIEQKEVLRLALEYHRELTAKMKEILTPEQFAKWEPAREAHHKEVVRRDKERDAGKSAPPDRGEAPNK